jgi:hypothetical protein
VTSDPPSGEPPESWVQVSGEGAEGRDPQELVPGTPVHPPVGPTADPVFPSLQTPSPPPDPVLVYDAITAAAMPLTRNLFTLTPIPPGLTKQDLVEEQERLSKAPVEQRLGEFDQPEKDRVFTIAEEFVRTHVRRIARSHSIRSAHRYFDVGTVVISDEPVPSSHLRHAKLQWAVSSGRVVELQNARLPVAHLEPIQLHSQPPLATPHRGDDSDLAFLLAYVCDLLDIDPPEPVAATGVIALEQNHVLHEPEIEVLLDAAQQDHMSHVLLPFNNGKVNGLHDGVRYWSVRDTNEAVVSLLAALAHEVVVPNIRRRALTKAAYSWSALIFALAAVGAYQLAAVLGRNPPVTFERYLLGVVVVLLIGSVTCTHRFWRLDR